MSARGSGVHERSRFVEDLLAYMTLEEKLGQLNLFHRADDPAVETAVAAGQVGGVVGASAAARLQSLATQHSRLGIPLLVSDRMVAHALSPWALAATWDEDLARSAGADAARAAIEVGCNAIIAPGVGSLPGEDKAEIDIVSGDAHLAARLATAFAQGARGLDDDMRSSVLAMSSWRSGAAENALAWSIAMVRADDNFAVDCAALDRPAAQRAGFTGLLVAECRRISALVARQFAITSAPSAIEAVERLFASEMLSDIEIDAAVRGVLGAKHAIGLFREPQRIVTPTKAGTGTPAADAMVRGSFVLLRNEAGLLPLSPVSDKVLVVGNAASAAGSCADALNRAGIGYSVAPGLAQRGPDEPWDQPVAGDSFALSLSSDAARRADFVLVALEDRHFGAPNENGWRRPTAITQAMLRGLSLSGTRLMAVLTTAAPVDLAESDQFFAAVLQCWLPGEGFEEALSDILSGRSSPQGRLPAGTGRYEFGHGLGFGESVLSGLALTAGSAHVAATVRVRNAGAFAMRETVQVYVRNADGVLRLVDFQHVALPAGEAAQVAFELGIGELGEVSPGGTLEVAPGRYDILVGKSMARALAGNIDVSSALARAMTIGGTGFLRLAAG